MLRLAKVVGANPQAHTVDIVMLDTADRIPNVQVLALNASTSTGMVDLPTPTAPADPYGVQNTGGRDVFAYVAFAGRIPVVMGFQMPEIGQMTFAEKGLRVDRHGSDVYSTTADDGSWERAWPNGLWMGVQSTPGHVDRTGTDFDGQWKIARNTEASYTVTLSLPNGAGSIQIDPEGNATLDLKALTINAPTTSASGTLSVGGAATLEAGLSVGGSSTFTGPSTFNGFASFTDGAQVGGQALITSGAVGAANGVASLDGSGKVPASEVPAPAAIGAVAASSLGAASGVATLDVTGHVPTSQLPAAVLGAMNYQGGWNASTNTPALTSSTGTKGYFYKVTTAGTTNLNGNASWSVGDIAAFDGATWDKFDGDSTVVMSFNGRIGAVDLASTDVTNALGYTPLNEGGGTVTGAFAALSTVVLSGESANLGGVTDAALQSRFALQNSGSALMAWNKSSGGGETDLIINRGAGGTGGLNIYDYSNAGVSSLIYSLDGAGDLNLTGTWAAWTSDRRKKTDIEPISDERSLDVMTALKGVNFTMRDTGSRGLGFIAQDVKPHSPISVRQGADGFLALDYVHLIAYAPGAIRALNERLSALEAAVVT